MKPTIFYDHGWESDKMVLRLVTHASDGYVTYNVVRRVTLIELARAKDPRQVISGLYRCALRELRQAIQTYTG